MTDEAKAPPVVRRFLMIAGAVPIFSMVVLTLIGADLVGDMNREFVNTGSVCKAVSPATSAAMRRMCTEFTRVDVLRDIAFFALLATIAVPLVLFAVRFLVRRNRNAASLVFPPVVTVALVGTVILVPAEMLLFLATVYLVDTHLDGSGALSVLQFLIYGPLALGVVVILVMTLLALPLRYLHAIVGKEVFADNAPDLLALIADVSGRLGIPPPDHVVLGLRPGFSVTTADVELAESGAILWGRTLYLSLPYLKLLSCAELRAVVAHEMAHFAGEDHRYSERFLPAYSRLYRMLAPIEAFQGHLFVLPAEAAIHLILAIFEKTVVEIDRDRELAADGVAARLSSPQAAMTALVKMTLMDGLYEALCVKAFHAMSDGKPFENLSETFVASGRTFLQTVDVQEVSHEAFDRDIDDPTRVHPSLARRALALGLEPKQVAAAIEIDHAPGVADDLSLLEKDVSRIEQEAILADGWTGLPWR